MRNRSHWMVRLLRRRAARVALAAAATLALAGGVAYAVIPDDGSGVIHACYGRSGGALHVIDPDTDSCRANEVELTWKQDALAGAAAGGDLTGTYPDPEIAAGVVGSPEIAANAVGASEIAANAVGSSEIASGAVTPDELGTIPAARVYTASVLVPTGSGATIDWTGEAFDTADLHESAVEPELLTAPIDGIYLLTLDVQWLANATGERSVQIEDENGAVLTYARGSAQAGIMTQHVSTVVQLSADDGVSARVGQDSGANLEMGTGDALGFSMVWLGPA